MRDFFASKRKETKNKNVDGEPSVDCLHFTVDGSEIVATEIETEIRLPVATVNRVVDRFLIVCTENAHSRRSKDVERNASSDANTVEIPVRGMQQSFGGFDHRVERFPDSVQVVDIGTVCQRTMKKST